MINYLCVNFAHYIASFRKTSFYIFFSNILIKCIAFLNKYWKYFNFLNKVKLIVVFVLGFDIAQLFAESIFCFIDYDPAKQQAASEEMMKRLDAACKKVERDVLKQATEYQCQTRCLDAVDERQLADEKWAEESGRKWEEQQFAEQDRRAEEEIRALEKSLGEDVPALEWTYNYYFYRFKLLAERNPDIDFDFLSVFFIEYLIKMFIYTEVVANLFPVPLGVVILYFGFVLPITSKKEFKLEKKQRLERNIQADIEAQDKRNEEGLARWRERQKQWELEQMKQKEEENQKELEQMKQKEEENQKELEQMKQKEEEKAQSNDKGDESDIDIDFWN